jgi:hypothetical protein
METVCSCVRVAVSVVRVLSMRGAGDSEGSDRPHQTASRRRVVVLGYRQCAAIVQGVSRWAETKDGNDRGRLDSDVAGTCQAIGYTRVRAPVSR